MIGLDKQKTVPVAGRNKILSCSIVCRQGAGVLCTGLSALRSLHPRNGGPWVKHTKTTAFPIPFCSAMILSSPSCSFPQCLQYPLHQNILLRDQISYSPYFRNINNALKYPNIPKCLFGRNTYSHMYIGPVVLSFYYFYSFSLKFFHIFRIFKRFFQKYFSLISLVKA